MSEFTRDDPRAERIRAYLDALEDRLSKFNDVPFDALDETPEIAEIAAESERLMTLWHCLGGDDAFVEQWLGMSDEELQNIYREHFCDLRVHRALMAKTIEEFETALRA